MKRQLIILAFLFAPLGSTELCRAVYAKDEAKVRELISQGANLEEEDRSCWWPLWYALDAQSHTMTKLLLDAGADPNHMQYQGFTPLDATNSLGVDPVDIELLKLLLEGGANPNQFDRRASAVCPAFHMAAYCVERDPAYLEVCRLMVDYGADPYQKCGQGKTAIYWGAIDFARRMTPHVLEHSNVTDVCSFFEKQVDRYLELKAVLLGE